LIVQLLIGIALTANRSFFPVFVSERLGYATVFVSSLVATQQVAGMISALIGGSLCDVLGPKRTLLVGLLGYGLGSLTFLIGEPWLVAVLWACSGLAMGMHTLGGMAYLMEAASPRRLGTFSALYNWGITIGGALASPMLGVVLDRRGFGTLGAVLVTLAVATTCGAAVALSSVRSGRSNQTRHLGQTLLSYRTIIRRPPIALLGLLRFLPTCYWGMAGVLIPLLINRLASSKTTIAWFAATSQVLAALSQFAVGRAADRWGRKAPTIVALGVLVGSCLGMAVFADRLWSFFTFGVTATMAAWSLSTLMISPTEATYG